MTKSIGNGDPLLECGLLDLWEFQNYNFIVWRKHVLELFDKEQGRYLDAGCRHWRFYPRRF